MGERYNRKHYSCRVCGKKHFAKELCQYHYQRFLEKKPFNVGVCYVKGCSTKTNSLFHLCSYHNKQYQSAVRKNLISQITKDMVIPDRFNGGLWGYKDYRKIQKLKKNNCAVCGGNKNLVIHHIDNDTRNSSSENLVTACNKCHMSFFHKGEIGRRLKYGVDFIGKAKEFNCSSATVRGWYMRHKTLDGFFVQKRGRPMIEKTILK